MRAVTDLTQYRAMRQSPLMCYLDLTKTIQQIVVGVITFQFAAHRDFLRNFVR